MRFPAAAVPFLLCFLTAASVPTAAADPVTDPPARARSEDAPTLPLRARLDADAIARAVRDTLATGPQKTVTHGTGPLRADTYADFGRRFDDARVPGCLRPDAMKLAPPHIGPIAIGGIYALPFLALAAVRGKCN